jgi:branched-chain amino acid transport system substrate-binding protein
VAVLGEVASSNSMAAGPVAQQYMKPMISPSSTNPDVTRAGDYVFRVCFIDPFQGYVMAKFASSTLKLTKVAVLRDIKSDYSVGLANVFVENFKRWEEPSSRIRATARAIRISTRSSRQSNPRALKQSLCPLLHGGRSHRTSGEEAGNHCSSLGGDGWDSRSCLRSVVKTWMERFFESFVHGRSEPC